MCAHITDGIKFLLDQKYVFFPYLVLSGAKSLTWLPVRRYETHSDTACNLVTLGDQVVQLVRSARAVQQWYPSPTRFLVS